MDNNTQRYDRALALAGVVQAATLVKQLAWKGNVNQEDFETCILSLFQTDPENTVAVYGRTTNLSVGLRTLLDLFQDAKSPKDPEIARYTISLLHLERLLIKKPDMINVIQRGISRAKNQALHFSPTHENVIANLASVYTDTLSTFKFRIHVSGESTCLSNPQILNKVRAVLFAGIRSAVLWRQLGGSRWQLVFAKKSLLQDTRYILTHPQQHELTHSE